MKQYYLVYQIRHRNTNQIYIGIHRTKNKNDNYMGSGKRIKAAIAKYGVEEFERTILYEFDNEKAMLDKEAELVTEEFCLRKDTYNICPGGFGGGFEYINKNNLAVDLNEQRKRNPDKVYEWAKKGASKGGSNTVQTRLKNGLNPFSLVPGSSWQGRKHSEETKQKMSNRHKGKHNGSKNSQFGTMWITNGESNCKIKQNEDIPEGWKKGRILFKRI